MTPPWYSWLLYFWYRVVAWAPKVMRRGTYYDLLATNYDLLNELEHVKVCAGLALDAIERDPEAPTARGYLYACIDS